VFHGSCLTTNIPKSVFVGVDHQFLFIFVSRLDGESGQFSISMDYSDNMDGKGGLCSIVGMNGYGVGIATASGLYVFHLEHTAVIVGIALFDQLAANDIVSFCPYLQYGKRITFVLQNLYLDRQRLSGLTLQTHPGGTNLDKSIHFSGDYQIQHGLFRVVGLHTDSFPFLPSPIIAGIETDGYASLLPGKDLPRTRRGGAASAGLDFKDIQRFVPPVIYNELVHNLHPFRYRLEFEHTFGKIGLRSRPRIGRRGMAEAWRQTDQGK
jgi:hypothetical protein